MKRYHLILLSILSGLLFSAAWPVRGFPPLLFIALVPLLLLEEDILQKQQKGMKIHNFTLFLYSYPGFLVWNALTTYWIYNSTAIGGIVAILLNSFFMALIFTIFHISRRVLQRDLAGFLCLIVYWISFEYVHLHWELSWPWLNLGNGFATYIRWIQWYEYTGTIGGTLWILVINILILKIIHNTLIVKKLLPKTIIHSVIVVIIILIPILISSSIYRNYREVEDPVNVVVVQPNLDPYSEQYGLNVSEVMDRILGLAAQKCDSATCFVVCPESAIQDRPLYESEMLQSYSYNRILNFIRNYPDLNFVVGASTYKIFDKDEPLTHTARRFHDANMYYDAYNTALLIKPDGEYQIYHKSRLTPGVEIMPYAKYLRPIEKLALDLGGTVGSLGIDKERRPFNIPSKALKVAPVICYESAYGEFCTGYIKNGANLIFVITNDGWWGNTPGHRQHLTFSSLRAIETRRSIARSANTGISAFISQRGEILQPTKYWKQDVISRPLNANTGMTFYVRYGDYIARVSVFLSVALLLLTIAARLMNRKRL